MEAYIYGHAAFYTGRDLSCYGVALFIDLFDLVPYLDLCGLFLGENDQTFIVFPSFKKYIQFVTDLGGGIPFRIDKFMDRDLAFRLVSYVNKNELLFNLDNLAFYKLTFLNALQALFIEFHKII